MACGQKHFLNDLPEQSRRKAQAYDAARDRDLRSPSHDKNANLHVCRSAKLLPRVRMENQGATLIKYGSAASRKVKSIEDDQNDAKEHEQMMEEQFNNDEATEPSQQTQQKTEWGAEDSD